MKPTQIPVPDLQPGDGALRWVEADLADRGSFRQTDAEAQQETQLPVPEARKRFDRAPVPRTRRRHAREHRLHRHRRLQAQAHPRPHLVSPELFSIIYFKNWPVP